MDKSRFGLPLRVCIFARVSKRGNHLQAVESQIDKIKSFVDTQTNWIVVDVYRDFGSGSPMNQGNVLQIMLDDIRSRRDGIDLIVVESLDRLGRSPQELTDELLKDYKIEIFALEGLLD